MQKIRSCIFLLIFIVQLGLIALAMAQEAPPAFRSTGYPLPRFVSLGSGKVFVRTGPGKRYPVKWELRKKGLPVEIILEYENWRKIRDYEGETGWVYQSLLSGKRTALIRSENLVTIYRKPEYDARVLAYMEPNVVAFLKECDGAWCRIDASGYTGWALRKYIWGVYEDENF